MQYDCLIIDDEKLLADSTAEYFGLLGVKAAVVYSSSECRSFFSENAAQLLLLDINLGDGSGFELCRELRKTTDIPILFISVLLAKVKAVLKRYGKRKDANYADRRLTVDFDARQVFVHRMPVRLTALEFKLLAYLIRNEGRMIPKKELFEKV